MLVHLFMENNDTDSKADLTRASRDVPKPCSKLDAELCAESPSQNVFIKE